MGCAWEPCPQVSHARKALSAGTSRSCIPTPKYQKGAARAILFRERLPTPAETRLEQPGRFRHPEPIVGLHVLVFEDTSTFLPWIRTAS